jgi:putative thioredoxin
VIEARALGAGNPQAAEAKLRRAAELDANLSSARIELFQLLLDEKRTEEAAAVLNELERRGYLEPEAEKLKSRLHLETQAEKPHDLEALRQTVLAAPNDLQAKLDLAAALAAERQYSDALETALAVVSSGKKEFLEPARVFMVDLFRLLEDQPELVTEYRRRLSTALY